MGKGSTKRPCSITREAEDLQWAYAYGRLSGFEEYRKKRKKLEDDNKWWKK